MNLEHETTSTTWKYAYEFTWCVGMVVLFFYTYTTWPRPGSFSYVHEYYVQFLIFGLFYLGMVGARWRYYQYENLRMFCITVGGSLFICVLTLRALGFIDSQVLEMATLTYVLATIAILFTPKGKS